MKIIQITGDDEIVYGLTADGDVWQYDGRRGYWDKLPPLPVEKEAEAEPAE
jgi:hypothetical protein